MRILILGGSGSIGSAVLQALHARNCRIFALSRSLETSRILRDAGATAIMGDLRRPEEWVNCVKDIDAVIHAAATWGNDMDAVDHNVVIAILEQLKTSDASKAFIYTGGCWLYGNTGDLPATESTALSPGAGFSSAVHSMNMVLNSTDVRGMVIHPAMVYGRGGGVFETMYEDIHTLGYARIFGSPHVRWPLIHRHDLANIYALVLDKGKAGDIYNASAIDGVAVGDIAKAITVSEGCMREPVVVDVEHAKSEFGDWAEGYALDQLMSGEKARTMLGWVPEHTDVFEDIR